MLNFITAEDVPLLKKAYKEAVEKGKEQFQIGGKVLLTSYAKYLIEYLDTVAGQLPSKKDVVLRHLKETHQLN